jgi:hypothetical protein
VNLKVNLRNDVSFLSLLLPITVSPGISYHDCVCAYLSVSRETI